MRPAGRRPSQRAGVLFAAFLLLAGLSGCAAEPVTSQGKQIEGMYNVVLILAIVIFVGVVGAILYSVVMFRKRPGDDELPPQIHGNTIAEIVWTVLPLIIVLILFAMSYATLQSVDKIAPTKDLAAVINVRGFQWSWEFDYGDGRVVTPKDGVPVMVVPVGETVRVVETSDNVIHAWFVPHFLFKRDAVPGRQNQFDFKVEIPGLYNGQCAELCGTGHGVMFFKVRAVPRAEFDAWVQTLGGNACEKVTPAPTAASRVEIGSPAGVAEFDKDCLVAKAGAPTTIHFTNGGGLPHNVAIAKDPGLKETFFGIPQAKLIESGSVDYTVPAQPAGSYTFYCQVHPQMKGQFLVQ